LLRVERGDQSARQQSETKRKVLRPGSRAPPQWRLSKRGGNSSGKSSVGHGERKTIPLSTTKETPFSPLESLLHLTVGPDAGETCRCREGGSWRGVGSVRGQRRKKHLFSRTNDRHGEKKNHRARNISLPSRPSIPSVPSFSLLHQYSPTVEVVTGMIGWFEWGSEPVKEVKKRRECSKLV
jgi:hypothetical protein